MSQLLVSGTVLAAFFGGVVALLAPCCVSVMLPAYFASGFRQRSRILAMTFVFAAGVGTVILPIALGASFLSRLLLGHHTPVFAVGGTLMIIGGVVMALGYNLKMPMPGSAPAPGRGLGSVWALGAFSGAASACCAPVLAGVATLAGAAASFGTAVVIGVAYVFGMVAPLAFFALVWDRKDWGSSRIFRAGAISVRLGPLRRRSSLASLLAGGLLAVMGVLTVVLAFRGPGMSNNGWQVRLAARFQHYSVKALDSLSWLPGWAGLLIVFGLIAALVVAAVRAGRYRDDEATGGEGDPADDRPVTPHGDPHVATTAQNSGARRTAQPPTGPAADAAGAPERETAGL